MIVCGIDPGITGALCTLTGKVISFGKLYFNGNDLDSSQFKSTLTGLLIADCEHIYIERPIAFPGQSCVSTATTFRNYGRMLGLIETSGLEFTEVNPKDWTKILFAGMPKPEKPKDKKIRSLKRAWQLYPADKDLIVTDGQADAALIAYYGQSQN